MPGSLGASNYEIVWANLETASVKYSSFQKLDLVFAVLRCFKK